MTKEAEVLFKLIRIALGNEDDFSLPNAVNWEEVYNLSLKQGVGAIACDGMLALEKCSINEELRYKWMGQSMIIEQKYYQHKKAVAKLANFYHQHNIQMMLLKGYGLSLNYPIPEHRPSGDVDIFLKWSRGVDRDDAKKEVWKCGDAYIRQKLGIVVDSTHEHHTVFNFQNQTVENHYDFVNTKSVKSNRYVENKLKELAKFDGEIVIVDGAVVELPPPELNAIFLIRHMGQHFAGSNISIRHILDWSTFVSSCVGERTVDWISVVSAWEGMGLLKFVQCVNSICVQWLGLDKNLFYGQLLEDQVLVDRVLNDVVYPKFTVKIKEINLIPTLIFKIRRFNANRWKRKVVYKESMFEQFISGSYAHLIRLKTIKD